MSKLLAAVIAALVVGVGVAAASSLSASNDPAPTGTAIPITGSTGTASTAAPTRITGTIEDESHDGVREAGEDVSGPCHEAEHAADPRCTGGAARVEDDGHAGEHRGRGDDDADEDHSGRGRGGGGEDRSGSNSGSDD
jgi:hypothetical protein